jgi:RNA polymerase sigma-70 factor, ECF subfamily
MADPRSNQDVAQLVADHHQAIYRYAYRLTGSVQDAEDLAQQVFLIANGKLGQLRNINNTKSWLFAILRNCFLRDRQRWRPMPATDAEVNVDSVAEEAPRGGDAQQQLQGVLDRLPDAFRLIVVMFYFEECSYREIAEQLEIPMGTVMSRLSRARDCLRSLLFEPEEELGRRVATAQREEVR